MQFSSKSFIICCCFFYILQLQWVMIKAVDRRESRFNEKHHPLKAWREDEIARKERDKFGPEGGNEEDHKVYLERLRRMKKEVKRQGDARNDGVNVGF